MTMLNRFLSLTALAATLFLGTSSHSECGELKLEIGDHVCYIGNTMADRMQHHGWLETYIHALHPNSEFTVRNLGFSGDEVKARPRSDNFGSPDQWLAKCEADVVLSFFGYNEALRGEEGLPQFRQDLADMIDHMRDQQYNGQSPPRLVIFSPIAHEDLDSPHLPDGSENNRNLRLYTEAMRQVCDDKGTNFIDLFAITQRLYAQHSAPLTMNGIHLLEHGNQLVAREIIRELFPHGTLPSEDRLARIREAVLDKNYHWFSRYRVVDGYNVFGGRSKLNWNDQSNADVMRREMEIFDVMTANRDKRVWAVTQGGDLTVVDDNLPPELDVQPNKQSVFQRGLGDYLDGQEAIEKMDVHDGMQFNLFASEEMFPRLINPVQVAVDTDSRLWASVWPSYPHWNPVEPRKDALVILPDEDGDGVADECIVFADELNSITGFEFWGGGVLVAAPPEIWFLKDTGGDDKADFKPRMLQGISSADTHHSANAVVVGPDGWLYWSRGIFNVANFETPTKTYRSGQSGVHRFNPRTFEVEFHFPIGPNPHGDVFDQWGFQFANDGTSGTGSYVNIGKGQGNKQWFKKEWRPVAATGILSSTHFPPEFQGNFLVCNTIGFLGVLQHEVKYDGADITAVAVDPIVRSEDPNFRPSDIEIGGDGALYISDWHNALIGHMQHNMRDPNRDHAHGRIYRVTYAGRDLLKPAKMKDKPIAEVCEHFFSQTNSVRYRARLELTGRTAHEIHEQVGAFAAQLDPANDDPARNEAQALLECLWVFEEQRMPNIQLLTTVFQANEPRVRAAAVRTLGHWADMGIDEWQGILQQAASDESALVRAEAVKAAIEFDGLLPGEVIFTVATQPLDAELNTVLNYAKQRIDVDSMIRDAIASGKQLSPAARSYALQYAAVEQLMQLPPSVDIYRAILSRSSANVSQLNQALTGLAESSDENKLELLFTLIERSQQGGDGNLAGLGALLAQQPATELAKVQRQIRKLALEGSTESLRQIGYAAWVSAAGPDDAFLAAARSKDRLRTFLQAVPMVDAAARSELYTKVEPLLFDLPPNLQAESAPSDLAQQGILVDYFYPSGKDVSLETLAAMEPKASGVVPRITMNVPQREQKDAFALRFTGQIQVPRSGRYAFFAASDDGSRIYVDGKLVVNNDGLHGMTEKRGRIELAAGVHDLVVTYFDNGGSDGLRIAWAGQGIRKQEIPAENLVLGGGHNLHDAAVSALASIPGHETEKFMALSRLVASGKHRPAALNAISQIDQQHWPKAEVPRLVDNIIGYLTSIPASQRTSGPASTAMELATALTSVLPAEQASSVKERLSNLDVRVIAIGTVPHRMIFDKERLAVQAGSVVEFRFSNTDAMPHNFAVTLPGALAEVGQLAEATARDADAAARQFIPKSDKILVASRLLQPGETQAIVFEVPSEPGVYPYVCTYPGHWRRMYGTLYVVENLDGYQADPEAYLTAQALPVEDELLKYNTRSHEWTYDELIEEVRRLPPGRSYEVGKELFRVATCTGCHQLSGEGTVFGPDLAKLENEKQTTEHILRSLVDPSQDIDEEFQSYTFETDTGQTITGMIVDETDEAFHIVIDPLAKDKATVLPKDEIEYREKSPVSLMPKGLLDRLSREEILDLIAYVHAGGDKMHKLFAEGHEHHLHE